MQNHALLIARHGFETHLRKILLHRGNSIQRQHHGVTHLGCGMTLRRKNVSRNFRQVNHAAGMAAALLFVTVKQAGARLAFDNHCQLPCKIAGIAHAAVVALSLPDRHDVRGISRQQNTVHTKLIRQTGVVGVDALTDVIHLVRVCHHLAHQLGQVLRLGEFLLGFAGHDHEFKATNSVRQCCRDIGALGIAVHADMRRAQRVIAHVNHNPLVGLGPAFKADVQRAANHAVATVAGHHVFSRQRAHLTTSTFNFCTHARVCLGELLKLLAQQHLNLGKALKPLVEDGIDLRLNERVAT